MIRVSVTVTGPEELSEPALRDLVRALEGVQKLMDHRFPRTREPEAEPDARYTVDVQLQHPDDALVLDATRQPADSDDGGGQ